MAQADVEANVNESDYLRQEAENAKAAMSHALNKAKEALTEKVDPREVTRRHPWIAIGTAAAAGFAAIVLAVPSRHERELRRLERIREAMSPPPAKPAETNGSTAKREAKPSLLSVILKELIQTIRPLLMAAVSASVKAGANPPPQPAPPADDFQGPDKSAASA